MVRDNNGRRKCKIGVASKEKIVGTAANVVVVEFWSKEEVEVNLSTRAKLMEDKSRRTRNVNKGGR